ncbi:MAG TPA: di-heme oxidoredictase family protein [Blastocatellia bacterium]|nr:di-heme oxidoredictase family protein [Blastocatellia bacterium]
MKLAKLSALIIVALALIVPVVWTGKVQGQGATEAPTGFDTLSNGMVTQAVHETDRAVFEERDDIADGLGPVYNAQSCAECHNQPVTGAISQVTEFRAGDVNAQGNFVNPTISINNGTATIPNRSLINDRAICPAVVTDSNGNVIFNFPNTQVQARISSLETVRTFRTSLNTMGDGFIEAIDSNTLLAIANNQPNQSGGFIGGLFIQVPVGEANGALRGARFGWKNQHASLLSFAGDAYLNEQGITNRLNPTDVTSLCDTVADPEDHTGTDGLADIDHQARFMRATKAPSRDSVAAASSDAQIGQQLFNSVGCNICHVSSITTAPAGTVINGGAFTVPAALGNKIIHPYSDFLLHDVGTGDGIVQNGGQISANRMRTPPLWGSRTRARLMHDGESLTRNDAILRHAGEATQVINNYRSLSTTQKNQLIAFLNSL